MLGIETKKQFFQRSIFWAFLLSFIYWFYLVLSTHMVIKCDAIDYEALGKMLSQKGWLEYFRTGPNREPFYPALVALSVSLGKIFGISYQFIQVLIQFLFLLLTQLLTLRILRLLKINNILIAVIILYQGISPAIVNSALSLYSEISIYPFILAIILLIHKSWLSFSGPKNRVIFFAIITSLLFVIMILIKGIFQLVTPIFFFLFIVSVFYTRNRKIIVNAILYLIVFSTVFYPLTTLYKFTNKTFNGHFTIRSGGAEVLYIDTFTRMMPLTSERFFTALATVPGEGMCNSIFGKLKCRSWICSECYQAGLNQINKIEASVKFPESRTHTLILLTKQMILQNPAQYILFIILEGSKMFFWESTLIGFVEYSPWLTKFFTWPPLKDGLRLAISFLTFFAFVYLTGLILRSRKMIFKKENPLLFLYLCFLFIFSFVASHTIFCTITRYYLPLASLYLVIIAYVFQKICEPK